MIIEYDEMIGRVINKNIGSKNFYEHSMDTNIQKSRYSLEEDINTLEYEDFSGVLKEKEEDFSSPTINYNFISTTELKDLKKVLLYINEERNDEYEPYREQYHHWLKSISRIIERFQFGSNDHDLRKRESNQPRDFREL